MTPVHSGRTQTLLPSGAITSIPMRPSPDLCETDSKTEVSDSKSTLQKDIVESQQNLFRNIENQELTLSMTTEPICRPEDPARDRGGHIIQLKVRFVDGGSKITSGSEGFVYSPPRLWKTSTPTRSPKNKKDPFPSLLFEPNEVSSFNWRQNTQNSQEDLHYGATPIYTDDESPVGVTPRKKVGAYIPGVGFIVHNDGGPGTRLVEVYLLDKKGKISGDPIRHQELISERYMVDTPEAPSYPRSLTQLMPIFRSGNEIYSLKMREPSDQDEKESKKTEYFWQGLEIRKKGLLGSKYSISYYQKNALEFQADKYNDIENIPFKFGIIHALSKSNTKSPTTKYTFSDLSMVKDGNHQSNSTSEQELTLSSTEDNPYDFETLSASNSEKLWVMKTPVNTQSAAPKTVHQYDPLNNFKEKLVIDLSSFKTLFARGSSEESSITPFVLSDQNDGDSF